MKAILMAAGRGSRISRNIENSNKCTLDIGGTPLIRHTVSMLRSRGIEVSIVLGYRGDTVRKALEGLEVTYYYNPFFHVTNSIASLWFARGEFDKPGDFIMANADVYWNKDILDVILADDRPNMLVADSSDRAKEHGDYFFKFENGLLQKFGKDLRGDDISGEYIGICRIRESFLEIFKARLDQLIDEQHADMWWEDTLYSQVGERDLHVVDIKGLFWSEIDYIEDFFRVVEQHRAHIAANPGESPAE
jgi:choline kinase